MKQTTDPKVTHLKTLQEAKETGTNLRFELLTNQIELLVEGIKAPNSNSMSLNVN